MPKHRMTPREHKVGSDRDWLNELISLHREPKPVTSEIPLKANDLLKAGYDIYWDACNTGNLLSPERAWCITNCREDIYPVDWHSNEYWPVLLDDMHPTVDSITAMVNGVWRLKMWPSYNLTGPLNVIVCHTYAKMEGIIE